MLRFCSAFIAFLGLTFLPTACSDRAPGTNTEMRTIQLGAEHSLEIPAHVTRAVPANGAVLDFCAALVGPDRIAALPKASLKYSNIPTEEREPWAALPIMEGLHLEDLASAKVDLVIAHDWQEAGLAPILARANIPALFLPTVHNTEDILRSMHWVSLAFDVPDKGVEQNAGLRARAAALTERGKALAHVGAMVYSNYGAGGGTSGSGTSYDVMIRLAGLKNAATEAGIVGHVDLDMEGLLSIQPDFIILSGGPDGTSTSLETLRAALESAPLNAIENDQVVLLLPNELTTTSQYTLNAAENLQAQAL
ncbi:MAG: ABC transporter substrate-binding protein, partial [Planctomycetota bacterium]|nr:ABC transporter substrate-binding protein [Planctomycetota bacterium]